jgi:5-methylcytosine-specific restriction endonuclease McrA
MKRVISRVCTYCGEFAEDRDHVPSLSLRRLLPLARRVPFVLVPACRECNRVLLRGDNSLTVNERRIVVFNALKKKLERETLGSASYRMTRERLAFAGKGEGK